MSAKATQDGGEQTQSEYVEAPGGWSTVWVDHVEGTDVWVTEHVIDEAGETLAPHTVRCTWKVHKIDEHRWIVSLESGKRMFNGCANGCQTPHAAHVEKLERELKIHYLDEGNSSSTELLEISFEGVSQE